MCYESTRLYPDVRQKRAQVHIAEAESQRAQLSLPQAVEDSLEIKSTNLCTYVVYLY